MAELLKLSLDGIAQWQGRTTAMLARLQDQSPVFEVGDQAFRLEMAKQFETEGGYLQGGVQWAPLNPSYAARKPTPPSPFGILYRTGALFESLARDDRNHVKIIAPDHAVYGSTVPYGKYHQEGGVAGRPPRRRIIIVTDRLRRFMQRALLNYVVRGRTPGSGATG